jgi:phosphoribosylaminoimidazolecarboxamide formyltransferase/IMP cyclohydrolase
VIVLNRPVDAALGERLSQNFIEVLLAPGYAPESLEALQRKEAIRILEETEQRGYEPRERDVKRVRGGLLVQDPDRIEETRETMSIASAAQPTDQQWVDMLFSWKVCRHVRSNAIVIARDGATLGIGAGQMSRVDSVRIAIDKCHEARGEQAAELLAGSALASDAFFPFADGPRVAMDAGVSAFIQPGGSKRDDEVTAAIDEHDAAMLLTARRHFRH